MSLATTKPGDKTDARRRVLLPSDGSPCVIISSNHGSSIVLKDDLYRNEVIHIRRYETQWCLAVLETFLGVTLNGCDTVKDVKYPLDDMSYICIGSVMLYYYDSALYISEQENFSINGLPSETVTDRTSSLEYPEFIRSTRLKHLLEPYKIDVLPPKGRKNDRQDSMLTQLVPSFASLMLVVVFRGFLGSGSTMVYYSVGTISVGIIMSVVNTRRAKQKRETDEENRRTRYLEQYIKPKLDEIHEARKKEYVMRHQMHRPYRDNLDIVRHFSKGLFDRAPDDADFLDICIGEALQPAQIEIQITKNDYKDTDDDLIDYPSRIAREYRDIDGLPVVCKLRTTNGVGIIGVDKSLYRMLKLMSTDLCVRHYYKEVRLLYVFKEEDLERFMWTRWLRNCRNDDDTIRNLVYDDESAKYHLDSLFALLAAREAQCEKRDGATGWPSYHVIFAVDIDRISHHPVSQFFEKSAKLGVTFLFFSSSEERVPMGCSELIRLDDLRNEGEFSYRDNDEMRLHFTYPDVSDGEVLEITRKLCPVYVVEANLESELTKNISLYETLGVKNGGEIDILNRWNTANVSKTLKTPLGVKAKNELVYLDLHEKGHGPHGLVAGTTGSGKSEIMQSYILSMSLNYHPHDVAFLIIDFKAGGMVNQFEGLPHLIGAITNLEGNEVQRSLKAIRAEKIRRESLFAYNKVNNIDDYIRLHKKSPATVPALPHLIIIVDEFGELKAEQPEFMAELISIARVGRSLGIHLVLATQKPAGLVNDQILSNSKFKLCLKVQSRDDSNEMLQSPLAAEIREPGRAYLKVGNGEIFDLFQSAYSGTRLRENDDGKSRFSIASVSPWGKQEVVFDNRKEGVDSSLTELKDIIKRVANCCKANNIEPLNKICMSPLKDLLWLSALKYTPPDDMDIYATIGMYDDPEMQTQDVLAINLTESHSYLVGAAQTGKTVFLQTALMSLAMNYTPEYAQVYIVDGGNGMPKGFEKSGMVGGICYRDEEERLDNFINMLRREMKKRRDLFNEAGVGNFRAYLESSSHVLPWLIVFIDNIGLLREFCEQVYDALMELSKESLGVGIAFLATASNYNSISPKLLLGFGTKIALNCNDADEYSNVFSRCRMEPKDNPGRGLVMIEKRIIEYQTAWYAEGKNARERNDCAVQLMTARNEDYNGKFAPPIPMMPDIIKASETYAQFKRAPYCVPLGVSHKNMELASIEFMTSPLISIMGKNHSGKTNMVRQILTYIKKTALINRTVCYIIDNTQKQLEDFSDVFGWHYSISVKDAQSFLEEIVDELRERRNSEPDMAKLYANSSKPLIMLVVENEGFGQELIKAADTFKLFEEMRLLCKQKAAILINNIDNRSTLAPNAYEKMILNSSLMLIMEDLINVKLVQSVSQNQAALKRQYPKQIRMGDAYTYVNGAITDKIRTLLCDIEN